MPHRKFIARVHRARILVEGQAAGVRRQVDANDRDPEAVLRRDRPDDRQAVGGPVVQTAQGLAHPAVAWAYRTAAPTYRFRTEAADGRGGLVGLLGTFDRKRHQAAIW